MARTISDYMILEEMTADRLANSVFAAMENHGFEPYGSLCVTATPMSEEGYHVRYTQAMVQYSGAEPS